MICYFLSFVAIVLEEISIIVRGCKYFLCNKRQVLNKMLADLVET